MGTLDKIKMILLSFICCIACVFVNCQNKNTSEQHNNQVNLNNSASSKSIEKQFIELANAIKNGNSDDLKTFFIFPVKNEDIWYKVLQENELVIKNVSKLFTDKDFEKYCNKLFDTDIKKTIATLNFDKISFESENIVKSDTVLIKKGTYLNKCVLSINFNENGVMLSVLSNLYDENNEFLTEHIDKYNFIISNNKLLFNGFEMID